jgi:hypothetical protein
MHDDTGATKAGLEARISEVERLAAAYTHDHTGWLIALQAIAAVGVVRQLSAVPDPNKSLADWEAWARQVVQATEIPASAKHIDTGVFRQRALEKLSIFFGGINVSKR